MYRQYERLGFKSDPTYRDICLIMLRAILIESERFKENYTLQNFLLKHDREDLKQKVDDFLGQQINSLMTVRKALKITVDKFIAHNDTLVKYNEESEDKEFRMEDFFIRHLFLQDMLREEYPFTIYKIVNFIQNILDNLPESVEIEPNLISGYKK